MQERTYTTPCGEIHYWVNKDADHAGPQLVFLPGLTADHRLFDKQIQHFEGQYPVLVWDAPERVNELIMGMLDRCRDESAANKNRQ